MTQAIVGDIEPRIVAALFGVPRGQRLGFAKLRSIIKCDAPQLSAAIKAMREDGAIDADRIALTAAKRAEVERAAAPAPPVLTLAEQVKQEASTLGARRAAARSTGSVKKPVGVDRPELSLVEQIQSELARHPEDVIRAINRRHPDLWQRVLKLGRSLDEHPATALYRALAAGLDVLEADVSEAAA